MKAADAPVLFLREALSSIVPLPDEAWAAATDRFSLRCFAAGQHVFEAGACVRDIFFLTSGMARYYYLDLRGREFNKSYTLPGQALSSVSSFVTGAGSPFNVQVLVRSECVALNYSDFLALAERFRPWETLRVRMLEHLVIKRERREADLLLLSAQERYE